MASSRNRRSSRIVLRIPLQLSAEADGSSCSAETAVINRDGALVLAQKPFPEGTILQVQNLFRRTGARFKVVWFGGEDLPRRYKLGLEIIDARQDFWDHRASSEKRRSPRRVRGLRLEIDSGPGGTSCLAETADVSEEGALVVSKQRFPENAVLQVQNLERRVANSFRVVRYGGEDSRGQHNLGLEMIGHQAGFWG